MFASLLVDKNFLFVNDIQSFWKVLFFNAKAGEAGGAMSGGERQRITLARAILKPASTIVLDEATAYADPENEALIQEAISKLVKGKKIIDTKSL